MADKPEEWIGAAEALKRVSAIMSPGAARRTIRERAADKLIRARAKRLLIHGAKVDGTSIPPALWRPPLNRRLHETWELGDFDATLGRRGVKAYGVEFASKDIAEIVEVAQADRQVSPNPQGRPPAAWWDDLWIEICKQLYVGELKPKRQADIASAMQSWAAARGRHPADSTIHERARKLWSALSKDDLG